MLGVVEVVEAVPGESIFNGLFRSGERSASEDLGSGEDPGVLKAEEEEIGLATVDNRVIGVISVNNAIIAISEKEEAYLAFGSVAFSRTLYIVNLVSD